MISGKRNLLHCWGNIRRELRRAPRVLLLLDYDGTLTPIVKDPADAELHPSVRPLLKKLSRTKKFILGIVSGRSLKDIRGKIGLNGIIYAGNHGLEISAGRFVRIFPGAGGRIKEIQRVAAAVANPLKHIPGAILENKKLTLSVHYRRCSRPDARKLRMLVAAAIRPWRDRIRVFHGKKVWDLRPSIDWNKGQAALWLLRQFKGEPPLTPFYIGDDRTDEDVFHALGPQAITARVGQRKDTAAAYYLAGVNEVQQCLNLLTQL
jgi:trehalose 6-phosphate phosphatase